MYSACDVTIDRQPGWAVLALRGEVNSAAAGVLLPAYEEAVREGDPRSVVLDFTDVDYINSSGIAFIVQVLGRARAESRAVIAVGLSEHYREVFAITRLSDFMDMRTDLESALGGLPAASG